MMSKHKKLIFHSIKGINIKNKKLKFKPNTGSVSSRSNDSIFNKTKNNNIYKTGPKTERKIMNGYKDRLLSAKSNFLLSSKSTYTLEKPSIYKYNESYIYKSFSNKKNQQNQANFYYNDKMLNDRYRVTKITNLFFKLKNVYNPHLNNYIIVKRRKNIIKEFIKQTKNNFNNNYKIKYYSPNFKKRNSILQCFNTIKEKSKVIDDNNSIANIVIKEFNKNKTNKKIINNIIKNKIKNHVLFPSALNIKPLLSPKIQMKTIKIIDNEFKNNTNRYNKNEKICCSPLIMNKLNKKNDSIFFKTLPQNYRINNNTYLNYSKTSLES